MIRNNRQPKRLYSILRMTAILFLTFILLQSASAQYTSVYNGTTYTSSQPYNLNVVYFVPNDVPLDTSYKRRVSEMMLWGQNFYKQNMISNGYGAKTFGLFKEAANPGRIKIIKINGSAPSSAYPYSNAGQMIAEINAYFNANPAQKTSEHFLIIGAAKDLATLDLPFYGTGRTCYAIDYPKFDIQYMNDQGTDGANFRGWYGGLLHELGHGLNMGHSHQTSSENFDPARGMNLMFYGNGSFAAQQPTFINRADCSVLNTCQIFATATGDTYYNGHTARLTALHASCNNGIITVSGKFSSSVPVTDVGIYQDPYATPSAGYYRVAWSVSPIGSDSFYIDMPVSEITGMAGLTPTAYDLQNYIAYNLQVVLILKNGETEFSHFPFSYSNNIPNLNVDFDDLRCNALTSGWAETNVGTRVWGPTPGYVCYNAANNNNIRLKTFSALGYTTDAFPFAYTTLTGDGTIKGRIRNASVQYGDFSGVMLRNGLADNQMHVSTGIIDTRGIYDLSRGTVGGNAAGIGTVPVSNGPIWVKLQRKGNNISSFYSADGNIWTPHHSYTTVFNNTIYAGMFSSGQGAQADIDYGSVLPCTTPSGWQVADIGTVSAPGTACQTTGNVHMESYGTGFVTGPTDNVTFMYKSITGNVNIVARIKKVTNGWNTLGGLMLRNTLDANSAFITTSALDTRGVFDTYRNGAGNNSAYSTGGPSWSWPAYMWLKLSRTGNTVASFYSTDGANWILFKTYTIPMNSTIYAGIVSSGMGQATDFDQVWINGALQTQQAEGVFSNTTTATTTVQVVPNPAQGEIRIVGAGSQSLQAIQVLDMYGHIVLKQNSSSDIVNISSLPAAVYIVEIQMANGEFVRQRITKL